jgi:hypothetical protein
MVDIQALAMAIALGNAPTLIGIILAVLYNNQRFGDMSGRFGDMSGRFNDFSLRLNDTRDVLRAEMAKNQSELLSKFADLDRRLNEIEQRR